MEILQDTLIQLIARQGSDSERKTIRFSSGEFGYTIDTKRLYMGDGVTYGGNLVGNLFRGFSVNLTTLSPATTGDLAVSTTNNTLYTVISGDGTNINHWKPIANLSSPIYARYNGLSGQSLVFSQNVTSVSYLSAGHYRFFFNTLPTTNLITNTEIIGLDAIGCNTRTLTNTNSSCDVVVLSTNGIKADANISLLINY